MSTSGSKAKKTSSSAGRNRMQMPESVHNSGSPTPRTLDASEDLAALSLRYQSTSSMHRGGNGTGSIGSMGSMNSASFTADIKYEPPTIEDDDGQRIINHEMNGFHNYKDHHSHDQMNSWNDMDSIHTQLPSITDPEVPAGRSGMEGAAAAAPVRSQAICRCL